MDGKRIWVWERESPIEELRRYVQDESCPPVPFCPLDEKNGGRLETKTEQTVDDSLSPLPPLFDNFQTLQKNNDTLQSTSEIEQNAESLQNSKIRGQWGQQALESLPDNGYSPAPLEKEKGAEGDKGAETKKEYLFYEGERVWIDDDESPFNSMEATVMRNTSEPRVGVYLKGKLPPQAKGKGNRAFHYTELTRESERE